MICGVHGFIGAALGELLANRKQAFWAGVASHAIADLLPHHDLSPATEATLAAGALGVVTVLRGHRSAAFWGAVGAMLPDAENGIYYLRGEEGCMLFPTHLGVHGRDPGGVAPQMVLALACLGVLLRSRARSSPGVDACASAPPAAGD